jgi:two-component system cell cycle response regulator DivK
MKTPIDPKDAHVLVVEDNVSNFVLIARLLAYMGVQKCEWKTTGWGVVDFAKTMDRVDLILMDLRLPHEDGYEALDQLRADEQLKDTLVVVVTAHGSASEMKKAQEAGFDGFITKPLDADRFPQQVHQILEGETIWDLGI